MQQDERMLHFLDGVVYPDRGGWHKLIDMIVPSGREVYVEGTAHQATVHDPDAYSILELLPQPFLNHAGVRQGLAWMGDLLQVARPAAFPTFSKVSLGQGIAVGHTLCHQLMFHQQVVNEKLV